MSIFFYFSSSYLFAIVYVQVRRDLESGHVKNERRRDCSPAAAVIVTRCRRLACPVGGEIRDGSFSTIPPNTCTLLCVINWAQRNQPCVVVVVSFLSFNCSFQLVFLSLELFGNFFFLVFVFWGRKSASSLFLKGSVTWSRKYFFFLILCCCVYCFTAFRDDKSFSGSYICIYALWKKCTVFKKGTRRVVLAAAVPNCDEMVDNFTACRMSRQAKQSGPRYYHQLGPFS